jgi:hypothetical protein
MKGKLFPVFVLFLLSLLPMRAAITMPPIGGGGGGGSQTTGSVTVLAPLVLSGTEIQLPQRISQLNTNFAITNIGSDLLEASNYFARVVSLTTNDNIASIIAASPNDTAYYLTPGYYTVTPAVARDTGSGAINIKNKTNILIQGVYGSTFIDGRSVLGDNFWITNSSGITLRWLTSLGRVVTNFVTVAAPGQFSHVSYYNVEKLSIEENQFLHGYDHGTLDMASQANWTSVSTNFIRIVRNYFDNFGSSRTNESIAYDGTAIVPIAGVIEGNVIVNSLRGIEPYADGVKATGRVIDGQTFIRNNQIIDGLEAGITFAGSTNIHGVVIENNTIRFTPGYSRRGTNTLTFAGGIEINGGQRHIVRGNKVYNPQYYGILVNATTTTGPAYGMVIEDNYIEGATNNYGSAAFGIYAADISDTLVNPIIDATIRGNKLRRISHQALRVLGGRNVVVENNRFDDVAFPGFTAALQVQSSTSVSSNVTVRNNFITDRTGNLGTGISVSAGTKASRVIGNEVLGFTSVAVDNLAGPAEVREYNTDSTSTNRFLRAHEVRTQIEAGSNITLATNSSGVVTITGAAGSSLPSYALTNNQSSAVTLLSDLTAANLYTAGDVNAANVDVTAGITAAGTIQAQSFIGSGAGAPVLSVQSYQGDAFALTRATNSPAATGSTNDIQFDRGTVKLGDTMTLMSSSAGQYVWTNGIITLLVTDTNSVTIDCSAAANNYVIPTLATNFTVSVTNIHLVRQGRSISVEFPTNLTTSSLQVTNKDALGMKWSLGVATNGYPSLTKTNTRHLSLMFTFPQTNYPVIDAAFY